MFRVCMCTAMWGAAALVAQADEVETAYAKLKSGLEEEVTILTTITDANSAKEALPRLRTVLTDLSTPQPGVSEKELWYYIDNTTDLKLPLIELIQKLSVQLFRLQNAKFFNYYELNETLMPQTRPDPNKTRD